MIDNANAETLTAILRFRAANQPSRIAYILVGESNASTESITYEALDRRARAIGSGLQGMGVSGRRALLLYPHGAEFIFSFFGCLYAGVIPIPLPMPRANNNARLLGVSADAETDIALTNSATKATRSKTESLGLRWIDTEEFKKAPGGWLPAIQSSNSVAFLQYTSGSTKAPRGVIVRHRNLINNFVMLERAFQDNELSRYLSWLPLFHDMGLIGWVLHPLYKGVLSVLLAPSIFLHNPLKWPEAIAQYRATVSGAPNFAYEFCARRAAQERTVRLDLSCWKTAVCAAEPIRADTLLKFFYEFKAHGFRWDSLCCCYGLAEATLIVSGAKPPKIMNVDRSALERKDVRVEAKTDMGSKPSSISQLDCSLVSSGYCLETAKIMIVDPATNEACEPGKVGEIWISGPSVCDGYWAKGEEATSSFHGRIGGDDQHSYLRSGDLGATLDGMLFVTGRLKEVILHRGRNIYPQDVEVEVEKSHVGVAGGASAAFGVARDGGGEGVIVMQEMNRKWQRVSPNLMEVINSIRHAVMSSHDVQLEAIVLVKPGTIPKTSSGKIQRQLCKKMFEDGGYSFLAEWRSRSKRATDVQASGIEGESLPPSSSPEVIFSCTEGHQQPRRVG
ncbi:MAG: fatty acyl-AMP ligase [Candidatus Binataceae bacterium]